MSLGQFGTIFEMPATGARDMLSLLSSVLKTSMALRASRVLEARSPVAPGAPAAQEAIVNASGARDMPYGKSPFPKIIPVAPTAPAAQEVIVNASGARDMP